MPIRKIGTPEYEHFSAILDNIKDALDHKYSVVRADEVNKPGSITKDIIDFLANSDLIIADLTDLNPNVFYELGVRHALRGSGTIMLLDEERTQEIPFDLTAYRVIKYKGTLVGIRKLRKSIDQTVADIQELSHKDSPVHDWIPSLPLDVVQSAKGSKDAPLREEIKRLKSQLKHYETNYGIRDKSKIEAKNPFEIISEELSNAEAGLTPVELIRACTEAAKLGDSSTFLKNIQPIFEKKIRLPASTLSQLAIIANRLEIPNVVPAIYIYSLQLYPNDSNVKRSYLFNMANSEDPAERQIAQKEIPIFIGMSIKDQNISIDRRDLLLKDVTMVGVLLDSYIADQNYSKAKDVSEVLIKEFPTKSAIVRNRGKILVATGHTNEGMYFERKAIYVEEPDDMAAVWLGNDLHNYELFREAAEVYSVACLIDPDDPRYFAHLADELGTCYINTNSRLINKNIPNTQVVDGDDLNENLIQKIIACCLSCQQISSQTMQRIQRAAQKVESEIDSDVIKSMLPISRADRQKTAQIAHDLLRTDLTNFEKDFQFQIAQQINAADAKNRAAD